MLQILRRRPGTGAALALLLTGTGLMATAPMAQAADTTPPLIESITLTSNAGVTPGADVTFSYTVSGETDPLGSMFVGYTDAYGRREDLLLGHDLPQSGSVSMSLPDGWANGAATALAVYAFDSAGNYAWTSTSSRACYPVACTTQPYLDMAPLALMVSGSTADVHAPEFTAASLDTPAVQPGQPLVMHYTLTDDEPPVERSFPSVTATFASGPDRFTLVSPHLPDGTLGGVLPGNVPNGTFTLSELTARDAAGNTVTYLPNGTVSTRPSQATGPTSHTIDFAALKVSVTGSTFDVTAPTLTTVGYPLGHLVSDGLGTISYAGSDDLSGIASVTLGFTQGNIAQTPGGWSFTAAVSSPTLATGAIGKVSTGIWHLVDIDVTDHAGNWARYERGRPTRCNRPCTRPNPFDFDSLDAMLIARPGAPSWVDATARDASAWVQWTSGDQGGSALTGYRVTVSPGGKTYTAGPDATSLIVPGLANNVTYSFAVRAVNAAGAGPTASATAIPRPDQRLFIGDSGNDAKMDIIGVTRGGTAYVYRGNGAGGIAGSAVRVASGMGHVRTVLPAAGTYPETFFDGNVLTTWYDHWSEAWWVRGTRFTAWTSLHPSFETYRQVIAPGDFTGNAAADLLTVSDAGDLYLWAARAGTDGTFASPKRIGSGWQSYASVIGVGDLNGDHHNDLVARRQDGTLWFYAGNGASGFRFHRQIGASTGWKQYAQLAGMGDFTGDHRNDLLALAPNGYLYIYKGTGTGGFSTRILVSKGFSSFV